MSEKQIQTLKSIRTGFVLKHTTDHKWKDISSESYREYVFPNGIIKIDNPMFLAVSSSGGHRIAAEYQQHYIPTGWIEVRWETHKEYPHWVQ